MLVNSRLKRAALEVFTTATMPSGSSMPYRVIFNSDTKQELVSDGFNWIPTGSLVVSPDGLTTTTFKRPNGGVNYSLYLPNNLPVGLSLLQINNSGQLSYAAMPPPLTAPTQQILTALGPNTYTLPTSPKPTYIRVRMVGAGGGGGGGFNGALGYAGGGGGGSGAYMEFIISNPSSSYPYTIGVGGYGGGIGTYGGNGTDTTFSTNTALGGLGGTQRGYGTGGIGGGRTILNIGVGFSMPGFNGEAGDTGATGKVDVAGNGASGGNSLLGGGGLGAHGNTSAPTAPTNTGGGGGGGGGGAVGPGNGANGSNGIIIVDEFYN